jgi:hypothetical protein
MCSLYMCSLHIRYDFRFIKSLFPYDVIHKDYLDVARSNAFEVFSMYVFPKYIYILFLSRRTAVGE